MKYQIQRYSKTDGAKPKEVVAAVEGVFTENDFADWYNKSIEGHKCSDDETFAVVDMQHPWFQSEGVVLAPTNNPSAPNDKPKGFEGESLPIEKTLAANKKRTLDERAYKIKRAAEFEKMKRDFQKA